MPKLKIDPITQADLDAYLAANDDFAFELRCLHLLRQRPVAVEHAGTYADPVTGKSRQFDFRVTLEPEPALRVAFALECKNLKQFFPLMISRVPRPANEAFHDILVPRSQGHIHVQQLEGGVAIMNPSGTVRLTAPDSLYAAGEPVRKSTVQVGRLPTAATDFHADDSEVYDKWSQAVSSCYDLCAAAHYGFAHFVGLRYAFFVFPAVVVPDGRLWVRDYQDDGTPSGAPIQTDEARFFLNHVPSKEHQTFHYTISHLHFVTESGLASLVDRIVANVHFRARLRPAAV